MIRKILYAAAFLIKGWEVSLLLILPFIKDSFGLSFLQIGILGSTLSFSQIISGLFAGHIAEKISGKRVIILAIFAYSFAWLTIYLQGNFYVLMLAYLLGGIGSGLFMPLANSAIAQLSDKNRAKEMGDFSAFSDLGRFALTGLTTVLMAQLGTGYLSVIFAGVALILTILFGFTRLSVHLAEHAKEVPVKLRQIIKDRRYLLTVLIGMIDAFASSSLYIFVPFLLTLKGVSLSIAGFMTGVFFLGYMGGRIVLGRFADKFGAEKVLIISEIIMAVLIIALVAINNIWIIPGIIFFLGVFTRGTSPITRALVAEAVAEKEKFNKAYSFYSFSVNSSSVVSRSLYGFIAGSIGVSSVFYLASIVALVTILPISAYNRHKK